MIKKINIFLVLLLLLMSISAVSAADGGDFTDVFGNEAIQDTIEVSADENIDYDSDVLAVDETSSINSAANHTITNKNYEEYFNPKNGELISSKVNSGDTIRIDGSFSNKNFTFNKKVSIVGTSTNNMKNSIITLLSGASGSSITNLKIINTKNETYGIFLNSACNCTIKDCTIKNTGKSSYCICLGNNANYNVVTNNDLTTYGVTYGHNQRSTPPLVLCNSHYNTISKNNLNLDDANGIYLSSYAGGPLLGGESNHNVISENTIKYNVLPTSWSWCIQVMGSYNVIQSNKVIGAYRGISTTGNYNNITYNTIEGLTGADYNAPKVEVGGEYGIVASYNSLVANNNITGAKIISTGAGISAADNSIVENNNVEVTSKGRGIVAGGSNIKINNNNISTEGGSGVYQTGEVSGLLVTNNNITSVSGVGILIEKLSSKRMPRDVTITNNVIFTGNKYAIDASGAQADTSEIDPSSNTIIGGGLINSPAGVIDTSKPTYNYKGTTHTITNDSFDTYINANGGLTSEIKDGDILEFKGNFEDKIIYVTKGVKITGKNSKFINSTFKVTTGNVWIEELTIENNKAQRVNAWGIYVNQASGVKIVNNKISVNDNKASYAIYVLESSYIEVLNNDLTSEGDYLTFTLLAYSCEDCEFKDNTIHTKGTGDVYNFKPERCLDGNEVCIDGKTYCLDGNDLYINGVRYCLDGNEVCVDGVTYCVDGNEICIDGKTYCLDCNEVFIDGKSVCIDGNEVFIDGNKYCLDGNEVCIDGKTYNLTNGKITVDGITYCVDGNEVCIDGVTYCFDGNEVCIDGKTYCLDGSEVIIDGKSVCIDGNEVFIDGNKYCLDGSEVVIDGKSYTLVNGEVTVDGITYCVDGNKVCIDGKTYCFDGNEVCVDGNVSYCFDGNEHKTTGAHVVSEIYQTYGILLLYSSNNMISGNDVNVTSKLTEQQPTTGNGASTNSIVGIDLYFNCHNNTISYNKVNVSGKDNYIYGMGVLGYYTGHSAPEGQGATNNSFIRNQITLDGGYCVEGIIIGDESEGTLVENNVINLKSDACAYGIYFELSQKSTAKKNNLTINSQAIYGIEGYGGSSDNVVSENTINANGKAVYGVLFQNGNNNIISGNKINANGNGEEITVKILDSIGEGNAGIYLMANSTNNNIKDNEVKSTKGYAVDLDEEAINNIIMDNMLDSEKGIGNKGVDNPNGNTVYNNYKYVANPNYDKIRVPYLGTGEFKLTFDGNLNGAIVKFYDIDGVEFAQSIVSNGVASAKYKFDESYIPAQYEFSAKLFKEDYKVSTFDLGVTLDKSKILLTVMPVSIPKGSTGNLVATVLDELGNPIKGANVKFYRLNSADRPTPIGSATSNAAGIATLSYKVLEALVIGNYSMSAEVDAFDNYNSAEAPFILEVIPVGTVIVVDTSFSRYSTDFENNNPNCEHGGYFYATLYDVNGNPLADKTVQIAINGKFYNVTTNNKGKAGLQVNLAESRTYTYALFFQGDEDYKASLIASSKLTVVKKPTKIIANNMAFKTSAKTKTVTVALSTIKNPYDGKMYIRNGKTVTLKVNDVTYTAKTTNNGVVKFNIKINKAGTYNAVISFDGGTRYQSASKTIKITISSSPAKNKALTGVGVGFAPQNRESNAKLNIVGDYADYMSNQNISTSNIDSSKIGTKIVVDAAFSRDANDFYVGERGANFTGYLLDEDGKPVVNRTVQVAVNGPVYNLTTDENGAFNLQINFAAATIYTYAVSFSGDDTYNSAQLASSKLTVIKKDTSISASDKTFKSTDKTKKITVTLNTVKNRYDHKTYLESGKTLTLKINGQTYTAKTNAKGQATFSIKLTKKGKFTAAINFEGDRTYEASSKKILVTIK